jgi:hypothetical protein
MAGRHLRPRSQRLSGTWRRGCVLSRSWRRRVDADPRAHGRTRRRAKLRGADRTDSDLVEQLGDGLLDQVLDLAFEVVGFGFEREDAPGGVAERDDRRAVLGRVRWQGSQSRAALDELVGGRVAQLVT